MDNHPKDLARNGVFHKDLGIIMCSEKVFDAICSVEHTAIDLELGTEAFGMILSPKSLTRRVPPAPMFSRAGRY